MKVINYSLRLNKLEQSALSKAAKNSGMTLKDYIKHRIFDNNPELTDEEYIYEGPVNGKHNYISMGVLHNIYWLLHQHITAGKSEEETASIKEICREAAKKSITGYGYLKVAKDE